MHIQLCKVRKKNGAEKKIWAEKKNGPKRPTNLAETTQLQNWAETTQAETTRPKRLRTETTQGPKRFRAETSRDLYHSDPETLPFDFPAELGGQKVGLMHGALFAAYFTTN